MSLTFQLPAPSKKWSFEDVELAGPGPFEVDGKEVSKADLEALAGTSPKLLLLTVQAPPLNYGLVTIIWPSRTLEKVKLASP